MDRMLQELVEERKIDARERQIGSKAMEIACLRGRHYGSPLESYAKAIFNQGNLNIRVLGSDMAAAGGFHKTIIEIRYNGKLVYSQTNVLIDSYIPGVWTKTLDSYYGMYSLVPPSKPKQIKGKKEEMDLMRMFGL